MTILNLIDGESYENSLTNRSWEKDKPEIDKYPFEIFKNMLPEEVKRTVIAENEFDRTGVYTFKVSLSKSLWRKISVSHKHSLYDLHMAIQEAFNFNNDHLYAFYVGGNRKGQKLLYFFGFGDMWEFDIELLSINNNSVLPIKPVIVEAKGEPPEQYPRW